MIQHEQLHVNGMVTSATLQIFAPVQSELFLTELLIINDKNMGDDDHTLHRLQQNTPHWCWSYIAHRLGDSLCTIEGSYL